MRARRRTLRRSHRYRVLIALTPLILGACKRLGTVEGDLSMDAGGVKKGAYRTVALVRNADDSVTSAVEALCSAVRADVQQQAANIQRLGAIEERFRGTRGRTMIAEVALSDSVEKYRDAAAEAQRNLDERPDTISSKIQALIRAAEDTEVDADAQGHFRIPGRQPGRYLLYAEWPTAQEDLRFMTPVEVRAGKVTQDLDQSTLSTAKLTCR
jgi:lipopolysaccharide biosynthesis regulator YciM